MISRTLAFVRQFDRNLWILSSGWFISAMGFATSIPFIAIYFNEHFGMSMTEIGLFFGLMAVIRSLFQAIGGEVSDRIERRKLLICAQMLRSVAFLLMALGISFDWGFLWVGGTLLVNSVFGAIFQPAANAMVSDIVPVERRLEGYAITRSAGNLGWAVGPAIGGFLAKSSYALLFYISSGLTLASGLIIFLFLVSPAVAKTQDRFRMRDILVVKDDINFAWHAGLIFLLYLVVAQLIAPFSLYSVQMVGISESDLGLLYTLNGLLVVTLQLPMTRLLSRYRLTTQLAMGSLIYAIGYSMVGYLVGFGLFVFAICIITMGEIFMSPPSLALTSRLAPEGRMGRYMGVFGFFVASGWSFGPLYGGFILDRLSGNHGLAWAMISLLALLSAIGYFYFGKRLPDRFNVGNNST